MSSKKLRLPLFIADSLLVLPLGCVVALLWANTLPESYYRFSHALDFAINDVGIVFFFGVMTKEVVEATLDGGEMHPWRRAMLPIVTSIFGVIIPVALYLGFLQVLPEPETMLLKAWPMTAGVDVAVCYLIGGLIFKRHPAMAFMLLLGISSDAIGLAAIAALHHHEASYIAIGLVALGGSMLLAFFMRRSGVKSFWPYLLGPGALSWLGLYLAGVHPALALVAIVPFMPHARRDNGLFADPAPKAHDALSSFERVWNAPVQVILFLFGVVNAGVPVHGLEVGMWAAPIATLIGRPIGVLIGSEVGLLMGLRQTLRVGRNELIVIGCITSVCLTAGLFSATALFSTGPLLLQSKMGALLTSVGALLAFGIARMLKVGRFQKHPHEVAP